MYSFILSLRKRVCLEITSLITVNEHLQGLVTSFFMEKDYQHNMVTNDTLQRVKTHSKLHKYWVYVEFSNYFYLFFIKYIFFLSKCFCFYFVPVWLLMMCLSILELFMLWPCSTILYWSKYVLPSLQSQRKSSRENFQIFYIFELSTVLIDTKVIWEYETQNNSLRILFFLACWYFPF